MAHTAESLQQAFGYLFKDEVKALKQLAQSLPTNPIVVNIGAGAGTSGLAFMESRYDLILCTIDIQGPSSPLGCLAAEEDVLKQAGLWQLRAPQGSGKMYRNWQICNDSKAIGKDWQERFGYQIDMVFIDGDHSYEGCKGDIETWLPNIKPGGIMALHDYRKQDVRDLQGLSAKEWPDVDRAVSELLAGKYEQILLVDSLIAFRVE